MKISCVLLAAGLSTRMKTNKLLMPFMGSNLLMMSLNVLSGIDFYQRIVVLSKENAKGIVLPSKFISVINPSPDLGQASSIRLGLDLVPRDTDAILFCVSDQPYLSAKNINDVISIAASDKIVIPTYRGRRGNPVLFGFDFFDDLYALSGDHGGKIVIDKNIASCVFHEVDSGRTLDDIDRPDDMTKLIDR